MLGNGFVRAVVAVAISGPLAMGGVAVASSAASASPDINVAVSRPCVEHDSSHPTCPPKQVKPPSRQDQGLICKVWGRCKKRPPRHLCDLWGCHKKQVKPVKPDMRICNLHPWCDPLPPWLDKLLNHT